MTGKRIIVAGVLMLACAGCDRAPVTLGVTGSTIGLQAATMALEDARRAGFDIPVRVVMIGEANNRAGPAVQAADSLASTPGMVAVLGHSNSAASLTAAPIYNRARVVQLAPNSTSDLYSEAGPFSFRMVPADSQQGALIAAVLARDFPATRVAMVYVNDDYGRGLRASVLRSLPPGSVDLVAQLPHVMDPTPEMLHRTTLAIVDAEPDVVLWLSRYYQLMEYLPGLREALGRVPIVGGDGMNPIETVPDPEGLIPPVHFVRLVDMDARPETRRFRERFRARFGAEPMDMAALAYDGFSLLLSGVENGVRSGEEMRRYLTSLGRDRPAYPGLTGPIRFEEDGDVARTYVMGHLTEDVDPVAP